MLFFLSLMFSSLIWYFSVSQLIFQMYSLRRNNPHLTVCATIYSLVDSPKAHFAQCCTGSMQDFRDKKYCTKVVANLAIYFILRITNCSIFTKLNIIICDDNLKKKKQNTREQVWNMYQKSVPCGKALRDGEQLYRTGSLPKCSCVIR